MGFFSINVPLWRGKLRAQQREAEKRLDASREAAANARSEVLAEVRDAWFRAKLGQDQVSLYETSLIPQAEQSLASAQAGYQAARVGILDVLDSQRALLGLRLGLVMTRTDLAKALAQLERSIGVDLEKLSTLDLEPPSDESQTQR